MGYIAISTDCNKCGSAMPKPLAPKGNSIIDRADFIITAYRCEKCGHWNNLKRRKVNRVADNKESAVTS